MPIPTLQRLATAFVPGAPIPSTARRAGPQLSYNTRKNLDHRRESFAKYFSMDDVKHNEVKWAAADTGALLDVGALAGHYEKKGAPGKEGGWEWMGGRGRGREWGWAPAAAG